MSSIIPVAWAQTALNDISTMTANDFGGVDPKKFHEAKVEEYYNNNKTGSLATVNKARVRRGAHSGGSNPNFEKDHITVSYRNGSKEVTTAHVYTGR
ncbi:hypothetical protein BDP27DRAFT_1343143 [Rhodocollybia butyracea]|uniref:Uncharacterized protein n=1 Tax=Rhodocollybia butyracea TaxID=206335 RepID=A0A9P5P8I0_9AGAR|nr:hypothetical protein BDP27DRAFT_1343143 [Rhodocollybia butyracea]